MKTVSTAITPIANRTPHGTQRWVERGLLAVAVILLGRWGTVVLVERHYQELAWHRLEAADLARLEAADLARPDAAPTRRAHEAPRATGRGGVARTRAEIQTSGLVGRIVIPRANVSVAIAEGTDPRTLDRAVGHLRGTALPGEGGHVALAGHRDTFFRGLGRLRPGDRIRLRTPDGTFTYRVARSEIVTPDRT